MSFTKSTLLITGSFLLAGTMIFQLLQRPEIRLPEETGSGDWQLQVTQEIMASEYQFRKGSSTPFEAFNRRHGNRIFISENGFQQVRRMDTAIHMEVTLEKIQNDNKILATTQENWNLEAAEMLSLHSGTYTVEYRNTPEGFRQNFIVEDPGTAVTETKVVLQVTGTGNSRLEHNELWFSHDGKDIFRYGDLHVYDAYGKELYASMELDGSELSVVCYTADAVFPITIDPLSTSPDWVYESDQEGANMGFAVSAAGDVNNDGYADVVVGAAAFDAGETDEGKAFLFLGGPDGLSATPVWEDEGDNAGGLMGKSVAAAGDVNGDGYDDLLIGLGLYSGGQTEEGRAQLYYGTPTGVTTEPVWWFEPNQPGVGLGFPLEGLGDVNRDGYADVIIGGNGWDGDQADEGRAYVFYGSIDGLADTPDWTVDGNNTNAALGHAVSAAGDVNGDGYDDAIIGGWNYSGALPFCGKVWVYLGGPDGLASTPVWELEGDQSYGYFGFWVSGVGDVDQDGFDDIMVGAKRYDVTYEDEGKAWLYRGSASGPETTASWTAVGDNDGAEYAIQFGPAGDVNNDGYADVIMGAHFYTEDLNKEGKAYLYLGSADGLSADPDWTYVGGVSQANFGWSCDGAGDINRDGFDDVIVGAFKYSDPENDEGGAFVFLANNICSAPAVYALDSLEPTNASVSWSGTAGSSSYKITVKGTGESYLFLSQDTFFTITGLNPSRKYKSWVQTRCGSSWSLRSNVLTFQTPPMRTGHSETGATPQRAAKDWLYITNKTSEAGHYRIELTDIQGNLLLDTETGWLDAGTVACIDISDLPAGHYLWQTTRNGHTGRGYVSKGQN